MVKYLCSNCNKQFDGEDLNYWFFADGGSVICEHCSMRVVPTYDFRLMKLLDLVSLWASFLGLILGLCLFFFTNSYSSLWDIIPFLLPGVLIILWSGTLSFQLIERPIKTKLHSAP